MSILTPLNGTKTHPLSTHALEALRMLEKGPVPRFKINPGVVNRLHREGLAKTVQLSSPYKSHKGRKIDF